MPSRARAGSRASAAATRVRLKPQDSFDLIRLIARSQSDARKAVGELVQNSLDAGARRVHVTWLNERGGRTLRIHDDGTGIFPELAREEALRKIAHTIGASHKRALSPSERHQQMVLGKYGIGLLGFWCVSRWMEIKSRVGGGEVWMLRLEEDRPEAEVSRVRGQRTQDEPTFTEITLREVKESVARQVRPARLQAYLAGELRGQLLQRDVEIRIHDRIARGRATKQYLVRPKAYLGVPLAEHERLEVPGYEDARVELYYVSPDEDRRGVVSLSCGGTIVLDDIAQVDPTDPAGGGRAPWTSGRFEGVIDFPELEVAPSTRRGFVPNEAALDFLIALEKLEAQLAEHVQREEGARARKRQASVARDIRRAFAPVARRLRHYDWFDVRAPERAQDGEEPTPRLRASGGVELGEQNGAESLLATEPGDAAEPLDGAAAPRDEALAPSDGSPEPRDASPATERADDALLFPPGPLATVRVVPAKLRLAPSTERRLDARALDADGRRAAGAIEWTWRLDGPGSLEARGATAIYRAPDEPCEALVEATASEGEREASGSARVRVHEDGAPQAAVGIPEPLPIHAPSEPWRSRMRDGRWEYNEGHPDYVAVCEDEPRRVRYLIHLFAKEIVLRNFGGPHEEAVLERMIEVLTHLGDGRGR